MNKILVYFAIGLLCGTVVGCGGGSTPSPPSPTSTATNGSATSAPETSTSGETAPAKASEAPPAGGWGSLRGKFVYDGTPPQPAAIQVTKDQDFCGEFALVDESLVVNPDNKGLANVVVYLYLKRGAKAPEVHDSYKESEAAQIKLDNLKCRFEPHVSVIRTTQTLVVSNSDQVGHNTKIDTLDNPASNLTVPGGATFDTQFTSRERVPASVSCSIHPWMKGWLVVQDTPYAAVTNKDGEFEITNLPSGEWTFQVWHETGSLEKVQVNGDAKTWSRGRVDVAIVADETTDLGEVKVSADAFK